MHMFMTHPSKVLLSDLSFSLVVVLVEGISELGLVHGHSVFEPNQDLLATHTLCAVIAVLFQLHLSMKMRKKSHIYCDYKYFLK